MKVSVDSLIAALLDQRFHLTGDQHGGVSIYCRDCASLIGYYSRKGAIHIHHSRDGREQQEP